MILSFNEFVNESLIKMKKYTKEQIYDYIKKYLDKDVKLTNSAINFFNISLFNLKKKYTGYDPDKNDQEGPQDEYFIKILKDTYNKSI